MIYDCRVKNGGLPEILVWLCGLLLDLATVPLAAGTTLPIPSDSDLPDVVFSWPESSSSADKVALIYLGILFSLDECVLDWKPGCVLCLFLLCLGPAGSRTIITFLYVHRNMVTNYYGSVKAYFV